MRDAEVEEAGKEGFRRGLAHQYQCQVDDVEFGLKLDKEASERLILQSRREVIEHIESKNKHGRLDWLIQDLKLELGIKESKGK